MNQTIFIVDFPITCKPQKVRTAHNSYQKGQADANGKFFLHGNGCALCNDCLACPLPDCTWQPYPKPRKKQVNI